MTKIETELQSAEAGSIDRSIFHRNTQVFLLSSLPTQLRVSYGLLSWNCFNSEDPTK